MKRLLATLFTAVLLTIAASPLAHAQHLSGTVPLHQYYNPQYNVLDHFFTLQYSPYGINNWAYEREAFYVFDTQVSGTTPLHRYWNPTLGDHFYTIDINEIGQYPTNGYTYEGEECYVYASQQTGTTELHRYYHYEGADHYYTIDYNELGDGTFDNNYYYSGFVGWIYEGVECHVSP